MEENKKIQQKEMLVEITQFEKNNKNNSNDEFVLEEVEQRISPVSRYFQCDQ